MLVLVPCPLVLISSCPCCHWATNGTSLETQHQGISESLMTQLQKWIFLAEETKTGVVLEKKKSFGSRITLPFKKWHVL